MEMNALNAALLVNLIGFTVGVALYALVAAMVLRHRSKPKLANVDLLLLTTAGLGLLWNLGELYSFIQKDFASGGISPWLAAVSFSALGFLPSVVVHSAQADDEGTHWLTYAAYTLSLLAAGLHLPDFRHLRCPEPRRLRRPPAPDQHAVAGVGGLE